MGQQGLSAAERLSQRIPGRYLQCGFDEYSAKDGPKYGLGVSRLPLEITESAYTENPSQIIEAVESLKSWGS